MHAFVFVPGILMQLCAALFFLVDYSGYRVAHLHKRVCLCIAGVTCSIAAIAANDAHLLLISILVNAASFLTNGLFAAVTMDMNKEPLRAPLLSQAV